MHRPLIETASCCSITGTDWSHNTTLLKLHSSLSFLIRNRAAFDPSFFFLCTGLTSANPPIFWPALLYLMHRPFEVFTANHSVLLPAYPMRYTGPRGSLLCSCSGSMNVRWENRKPSFYVINLFHNAVFCVRSSGQHCAGWSFSKSKPVSHKLHLPYWRGRWTWQWFKHGTVTGRCGIRGGRRGWARRKRLM